MNLGLIFIVMGWIGVLVECLRPGMVLPGAAGALLLVLGYARILPDHAGLAAIVTAPFLAVATWLLAVALKARRNKRAL